MDRRLDSAYASQVRRFHAPLWHEWRRGGVSDEAMRQSLKRLYLLGYGDSEISIMFGVSRERVRQWRRRFALNRLGDVRGTHARAWDHAGGYFYALGPEEAERRARSRRDQLEEQARRARREELRERSVRCVNLLRERLNAVPTRGEIAAELRMTMSLLAATWREPSDTTRFRDAFRRLYAAASVPDSLCRRGRRPHRALSPGSLEAIRSAHDHGEKTITELAWHYRVSYACVWRIVRGRGGNTILFGSEHTQGGWEPSVSNNLYQDLEPIREGV